MAAESNPKPESRLKRLPDWLRFSLVVILAVIFGLLVFGCILVLIKIT